MLDIHGQSVKFTGVRNKVHVNYTKDKLKLQMLKKVTNSTFVFERRLYLSKNIYNLSLYRLSQYLG